MDKYILILTLNFIILTISACDKKAKSESVSIIHKDSYIGSSGILYEDNKNVNYKCYFDFKSKTNLLLCYNPECDHMSITCLARQSHPFNFVVGDKLYYLETNMVTYEDYSQAVISYLYQSNIDNPEAELVAEFEGSPVSDIYIKDNMLYILANTPKLINGNTTSVAYELYFINLKNKSITKTNIPLSQGVNENYIPLGFADNKIFIYHRYYDRIINPSDFGLERELYNVKDNENYKEYMIEVMKVFHEEMYYLDLKTKEMVLFDLPTPVLIHGGIYYYNKKMDSGSYSLMSLCISTNEEKEVLSIPAYEIDAFDNTLYIKEGIEVISEVNLQTIIDYDKDNMKCYIFTIDTGERVEIINSSIKETDAQVKLIAEYDGYYIVFYSSLDKGIFQRVGYIRKEDFHNGKYAYILVPPI